MRVLVSRIDRFCLALVALVCACGPSEPAKLERALVGRGRVALFGDAAFANLHPTGTTFVRAQTLPSLESALEANDPDRLLDAMTRANLQGVAIETQPSVERNSLASRMGHFARVPGFEGAYFTRSAAFYVIDPVRSWSAELRAGLANVARRLVA
ncbi:MAG TPA: hypothetical protein VHZ95_05420, partial [Polyangiales bacterium]|nr:hypothetical protein [Polyangiales bacterium]